MFKKLLVIFVVGAIVIFFLSGCKKSTEPESDEPIVKTMAEYEEEASKEITTENMGAELEEIEKAIGKEAAEE